MKVLAAVGVAAALVVAFRRKREPEPAPSEPEPLELLERSRARVDSLRAEMQPLVRALLVTAARSGVDLVVTDAFRTVAEQDRLYEQGRTRPGPIVTGVRGGASWHNYGLAADVAVLIDGQPSWPNDVALWERIGAIGEAVGLRWGGRWKPPDRPHFELRPPGVGPGLSPPGIS